MKERFRNSASSIAASSLPVQPMRTMQRGFTQPRRQANCMFRRIAVATGATSHPRSVKAPEGLKPLAQVKITPRRRQDLERRKLQTRQWRSMDDTGTGCNDELWDPVRSFQFKAHIYGQH